MSWVLEKLRNHIEDIKLEYSLDSLRLALLDKGREYTAPARNTRDIGASFMAAGSVWILIEGSRVQAKIAPAVIAPNLRRTIGFTIITSVFLFKLMGWYRDCAKKTKSVRRME